MTRRTRVPTEFRRPGTAAARLPARPRMIMAEYAYELRKSGQKRPKCCEVAPNLPDSDNITSVRVNQFASRGSGPLGEGIAHMRTTAITALLAVGVLAAAGTDCTDEALPGESPFTKAPTIASLALLATTDPSARNALNYARAPNSLIGGGVSAPLTASANSGPAVTGVTFAFNAVSRWRSDPERGRRRRRGTQLAHRRRRIRTAYGVCEQRPGRDRSDLCV